MIDSTFDPSLYVRPPVLTLESGLSLARALVAGLPRGLPAAVKKSADKLSRVADAAQAALMRRQTEQVSTSDDDRPLDLATDLAWRSLFSRLEQYALLPADRYPKADRARALHSLLAGGLNETLNRPYVEQVSAMDAVLRRIDDEGLASELNSLCGPEFLDHARHCQNKYQAMVQRRLNQPGLSEHLGSHVKALGRAIVEYATRVAASVDDDDADSVARAQAALRPIDNHRESLASRTAAKDPAPNEPTPPTPAPTPTPPHTP